MSTPKLEIRRQIIAMEVGQSIVLPELDLPLSEVIDAARAFGRARRIGLRCQLVDNRVHVDRIEATEKVSTYPELDKLAVGQSHLFELPVALHQRVRTQATHRNNGGKVRFACTREGDAIRVTRLPIGDAEAKACGPIVARARATIYDLERLSTGERITFNVSRADQSKLRVAVHRQTVKTGWTIRCRLQDDGSMLVYRTDVPAPAPTEATSAAQAAQPAE